MCVLSFWTCVLFSFNIICLYVYAYAFKYKTSAGVFELGAFGLPCNSKPAVYVPDVIRALPVLRQNTKKIKYFWVPYYCCARRLGCGLGTGQILIYKLIMSIKFEIRGPSPRCLSTRKELYVYFSESHRDSTIALRMEILLTPPACSSTPHTSRHSLDGTKYQTEGLLETLGICVSERQHNKHHPSIRSKQSTK